VHTPGASKSDIRTVRANPDTVEPYDGLKTVRRFWGRLDDGTRVQGVHRESSSLIRRGRIEYLPDDPG